MQNLESFRLRYWSVKVWPYNAWNESKYVFNWLLEITSRCIVRAQRHQIFVVIIAYLNKWSWKATKTLFETL